MKPKLFIVFLSIVLAPLGLLAWLGIRLAHLEREDVQHKYEALLLQPAGAGADAFARLTWQPTNFPDGPLKTSRRDPFEVLNLDRNALPMPSEAWEMPLP